MVAPRNRFCWTIATIPTTRNISIGRSRNVPSSSCLTSKEDPECLTNLAQDEKYTSIREELRGKLEVLLISQKDPRMTGKWDLFDSYPRYSGMREFMGGFVERGEYNPAFQY